MSRDRDEETWAALCVAAAIGVNVKAHDDGSVPGMYDFEITYPDRASGAVEVTVAADATTIELWKLVNGKGDGSWQESPAGG